MNGLYLPLCPLLSDGRWQTADGRVASGPIQLFLSGAWNVQTATGDLSAALTAESDGITTEWS